MGASVKFKRRKAAWAEAPSRQRMRRMDDAQLREFLETQLIDVCRAYRIFRNNPENEGGIAALLETNMLVGAVVTPALEVLLDRRGIKQ